MLTRGFYGGLHAPSYKYITKDKPIRRAKLPKEIMLSLSHHTGKPGRPVVKIGDSLEVGTRVAEAAGFMSANLHSSVSGVVKAIEPMPHPLIGRCLSVLIEADGRQKLDPCLKLSLEEPFYAALFSPKQIIRAISDCGVVGLGGAAFPAHVKLSVPEEKKVDTLIINGAECEPYLTCDHRLMLEKPEEIITGAVIICRALNIKNCLIGVEADKQDAIEVLGNILSVKQFKDYNIKIISLPVKYPQGSERQLIKTLLDRDVPGGRLPFEAGVIVQNVATAAAIYDAVLFNKPLYERVVTVSGDCLKEPGNLLVGIGTPLKYLVESCGGFVKDPAKIIFGGPMMGIAQARMQVGTMKGTSGVLFLSRDRVVSQKEEVCIRCGACLRVCPMGLQPTNIYYAAAKDKIDLAAEYGACDCIECGACSFECCAGLDLVGLIKYAKFKIVQKM